MNWIQADFKGTKVWAEVDEGGRPVASGGRRAIRYSDAPGAKVYKATAASVQDLGGAVRALDEGVPADPGGGAAKGGGGVAGGARSARGTSDPSTARVGGGKPPSEWSPPPEAGGKPAVRGAPPRPKSGRGSGYGSAGTRTASQAAAAATDAKARIAALPAGTVLAFTDGACTGNPGPAGSGAVVRLPDGRVLERHQACGYATNNVGELTAVKLAVDLLAENGLDPATPIALFTDSDYTLGVLTKGWKAKANVELISEVKAALRPWKNLKIEWVAGHVGVADNERADVLARKGVEESRRR